MDIHYKLIIDPEDTRAHGVVFIETEAIGRFAEGVSESNLPQTAADAIDLCAAYARNMQTGILTKVLPKEQLDRYRQKADECAELARKIRAGEIKTTYALSVERYLIREWHDLDDTYV
jgi:hypothetical protein